MNKILQLFRETRNLLNLPESYEVLFRKVVVRNRITPDIVYLFAQTKDNEDAVLKAVSKYSADATFLIPNSSMGGFAGFDRWNKYLTKTIKRKVVGVPQIDPAILNTYSEAQSLVNYLSNNNLKTVSIISAEFHQLRSFWSLVSAAQKARTEIDIYNFKGDPLSWDEKAVHSQGNLAGTRKDFIGTELDRIVRYQKKGDLISPQELLDYLTRRDSRH